MMWVLPYIAVGGVGIGIGLAWGLITGVQAMGDGRSTTASGVCFYCLMHGRICRPGK